jgi:transcriptional regulator with GAF, ATPase, and Fis domain
MEIDPGDFFRKTVLRLCGTLEIEDVLNRCVDYLRGFIPLEGMILANELPDSKMMQPINKSVSVDNFPKLPSLLPLPERDWRIRDPKRPGLESIWMLNEPRKDPKISFFATEKRVPLDLSLMVLKMKFEEKPIGELVVFARGTNRFTINDVRLLGSIHEPIAIAMANALRYGEIYRLKDLRANGDRPRQRGTDGVSPSEIVGVDGGLRAVVEKVRRVASFDTPVLLLGETGVGKGLLASAIHCSSQRGHEPLISVNCGAIPDNLIDSELFGYEKGAFTGAISRKIGKFERANGGSIFLDEVGELLPQAQLRLLHVLQSHEIERVGGVSAIPVDVRVILATNRVLEEMVVDGSFRKDLYYRINVFPINIPPLRERKEDLPALVHYFIEKKSRALNLRDQPEVSRDSMDRLINYDWPGNVRELENVVERGLIQHRKGSFKLDSYVSTSSPKDIPGTSKHETDNTLLSLEDMSAMHIIKVLKLTNWKISGHNGAAELLKMHPNTLRKKMDKLQIFYRKGERQQGP